MQQNSENQNNQFFSDKVITVENIICTIVKYREYINLT